MGWKSRYVVTMTHAVVDSSNEWKKKSFFMSFYRSMKGLAESMLSFLFRHFCVHCGHWGIPAGTGRMRRAMESSTHFWFMHQKSERLWNTVRYAAGLSRNWMTRTWPKGVYSTCVFAFFFIVRFSLFQKRNLCALFRDNNLSNTADANIPELVQAQIRSGGMRKPNFRPLMLHMNANVHPRTDTKLLTRLCIIWSIHLFDCISITDFTPFTRAPTITSQ